MQFSHVLLSLAAFVCTISAAPPLEAADGLTKRANPQTVVANYDDLNFNPALPQLNTVPRPYKGLCYDSLIGGDVTLATFTEPHSRPNDLASDITSRLTAPPSFSVASTNCKSPVKYFKANSFYFGCAVIAANSVASVPSKCTIQVTGRKRAAAGGASVSQQFTFTPSALIRPPMTKATLPSKFTDLEKVDIAFVGAVLDVTQVLALDDVSTTQYTS